MKANKTYYSKCPVFTDLGKKWLSMRLPIEETTTGDRYSLRFRREGSDDEYPPMQADQLDQPQDDLPF